MLEAERVRVVVLGRAQVPLADQRGLVVGRLQVLREGRRVREQSFATCQVALEAAALLVATGQEARARGRTDRGAHVAVRADDALRCEAVEVGRGDVGAAGEAEVGVAEVVGQDQQHVRSRAA